MTVLTLGHMDEQTTEALTFFVPGKPQTQGSKSIVPITRDGVTVARRVVESGDRARKQTWRQDIRDAALGACNRQGPVMLEVASTWFVKDEAVQALFVFAVRRPQAHLTTGKNAGIVKPWAINLRPTTRPDSLKLRRAAEDALTGTLWLDDSQIVSGHDEKVYADQLGLEPRAEGMLVQVRAAGGYAGPLATGL